jgi:hypothetical protein
MRREQQSRHADAVRLQALRAAIQMAIDELKRGEFVEVEDAHLEVYLDGLIGE